MKSSVLPDPMAHAVSHPHRRRAPVSLTPARHSLRRSVASWLRRLAVLPFPRRRHSSLVILHSHSSAAKPRTARKKTPAPKPFASPTSTAALAPTRFTPRHTPESRVNMRKALLSNGFAATQKPTKFRQPTPATREVPSTNRPSSPASLRGSVAPSRRRAPRNASRVTPRPAPPRPATFDLRPATSDRPPCTASRSHAPTDPARGRPPQPAPVRYRPRLGGGAGRRKRSAASKTACFHGSNAANSHAKNLLNFRREGR